MSFQLVPKLVTFNDLEWNGIMALVLRYFTKFGSFWGALRNLVEDVAVKKLTFAVSSPDEFLVSSENQQG